MTDFRTKILAKRAEKFQSVVNSMNGLHTDSDKVLPNHSTRRAINKSNKFNEIINNMTAVSDKIVIVSGYSPSEVALFLETFYSNKR